MRIHLGTKLFSRTTWDICEDDFDPKDIVTTGSNFLVGNGYLGYRGTHAEWDATRYTACIVSDTYDMADGTWRELCNVPNGLYTAVSIGGEQVSNVTGHTVDYHRSLDTRYGLYRRRLTWKSRPDTDNGKAVSIDVQRFAGYSDLHLLIQRYTISSGQSKRITLTTGIDGNVWSLHGEHVIEYNPVQTDDYIGIQCRTGEWNTLIYVIGSYTLSGPAEETPAQYGNRRHLKKIERTVTSETPLTLTQYVAVYTSNDCPDPYSAAIDSLQQAQQKGFDRIKQEQRKQWDRVWALTDIHVEGDDVSQTLIRFNSYHNIIAAPMHSDRLPIGARGLSCQAYQGAAFWDQEIFNMPMFLFTIPEVAKNILTYRYKTLDGAREKARALGYDGAFYAWISGKTGRELCPSYFFKDVFTGRPIHNHFNDWQIHVSPDIVYAIDLYYKATGDWQFIVDFGAEIIFEVARFLWSRVHYKKDKERYEIIRVLGPDEYHENVDNNGFTNYQCRFALSVAEAVYQKLKRESPADYYRLVEKIGLKEKELDDWRDLCDRLYLPQPNPHNRLIEQFDGFFRLEDTTPGELNRRILDRNEYWGWPNGVAVETQVSKQADVIQLLTLHPQFERAVVKANFEYYEPRTQHGSSLSPSAYAIAAARIGYLEKAFAYFREGSTIDLFSTAKAESGGTFIGGIHTAACGAVWQMIVFGFAGCMLRENALIFDPVLPEGWKKVSFPIIFRGNRLTVSFTGRVCEVASADDNPDTVEIEVWHRTVRIVPGGCYGFHSV